MPRAYAKRAGRKLLTHNQEEIRRKIQSAELVKKLQLHAFGEIEMLPTQIQAAKILLDKCVSNAPTEISGPDGGAITVEVLRFADTDTI